MAYLFKHSFLFFFSIFLAFQPALYAAGYGVDLANISADTKKLDDQMSDNEYKLRIKNVTGALIYIIARMENGEHKELGLRPGGEWIVKQNHDYLTEIDVFLFDIEKDLDGKLVETTVSVINGSNDFWGTLAKGGVFLLAYGIESQLKEKATEIKARFKSSLLPIDRTKIKKDGLLLEIIRNQNVPGISHQLLHNPGARWETVQEKQGHLDRAALIQKLQSGKLKVKEIFTYPTDGYWLSNYKYLRDKIIFTFYDDVDHPLVLLYDPINNGIEPIGNDLLHCAVPFKRALKQHRNRTSFVDPTQGWGGKVIFVDCHDFLNNFTGRMRLDYNSKDYSFDVAFDSFSNSGDFGLHISDCDIKEGLKRWPDVLTKGGPCSKEDIKNEIRSQKTIEVDDIRYFDDGTFSLLRYKFPDLPMLFDTAFETHHHSTQYNGVDPAVYFLSQEAYYEFDLKTGGLKDSGQISDKWPGIPNGITSATIYPDRSYILFIKDTRYYKWNLKSDQIDFTGHIWDLF